MMLNSSSVSVNKHDPTGPVRTIVSKSAVNLGNILFKRIQSEANKTDRQQSIAVATYRAVQHGFEGGYRGDWIKARAEIDYVF